MTASSPLLELKSLLDVERGILIDDSSLLRAEVSILARRIQKAKESVVDRFCSPLTSLSELCANIRTEFEDFPFPMKRNGVVRKFFTGRTHELDTSVSIGEMRDHLCAFIERNRPDYWSDTVGELESYERRLRADLESVGQVRDEIDDLVARIVPMAHRCLGECDMRVRTAMVRSLLSERQKPPRRGLSSLFTENGERVVRISFWIALVRDIEGVLKCECMAKSDV